MINSSAGDSGCSYLRVQWLDRLLWVEILGSMSFRFAEHTCGEAEDMDLDFFFRWDESGDFFADRDFFFFLLVSEDPLVVGHSGMPCLVVLSDGDVATAIVVVGVDWVLQTSEPSWMPSSSSSSSSQQEKSKSSGSWSLWLPKALSCLLLALSEASAFLDCKNNSGTLGKLAALAMSWRMALSREWTLELGLWEELLSVCVLLQVGVQSECGVVQRLTSVPSLSP